MLSGGGASVSVRGGLGSARAGGGVVGGGASEGGPGDAPASAVADFDSAMKSLFAKEKGGGGLGLGGEAGGAHSPAAHRNLLCATLGVAALVAFLLLPPLWGAGGGAAGAAGAEDGLRAGRPIFGDRFRLAAIADPDKKSKVKGDGGKDVWRSVYLTVRAPPRRAAAPASLTPARRPPAARPPPAPPRASSARPRPTAPRRARCSGPATPTASCGTRRRRCRRRTTRRAAAASCRSWCCGTGTC